MARTNTHIAVTMLICFLVIAVSYLVFTHIRGMGTLTVVTYPEGADVYIDSEFRGSTPVKIPRVSSGLREVSLDKDGYEEFSGMYTFSPRDERKIELYLSTEKIKKGPSFSTRAITAAGFYPHGSKLYLATVDGSLYALNRENKDIKEEISFSDVTVLLPPAANDEKVFITTYDGRVFGIDNKDFEVLWEKDLSRRFLRHFPVENGLVGISADRTSIFYLKNCGEMKWSVRTSKRLLAESFRKVNHILLGLFEDGRVVSVNLLEGEMTYLDETEILHIKFSDNNGEVIAIFTREGNLNIRKISGEQILNAQFPDKKIDFFVVQDEHLFISHSKGILMAIEMENGEIIWETDLFSPTSALLKVENKIFVGCEDGSIYVLNKETGRVYGRKQLFGEIKSLCYDPGILHTASLQGYVETLIIPKFSGTY